MMCIQGGAVRLSFLRITYLFQPTPTIIFLAMTETEGADEDNSNNDIINDEEDDDEDSRDSYESFDVDDVIRRIGGREADDYKMSKLTILEGYYLPNHGDWEVLGRAVGKNAYLREVAFYDDIFETSLRKKNLLQFLPGFAMSPWFCHESFHPKTEIYWPKPQ